MRLTVGSDRVGTARLTLIGEGGEAEVFDLGGGRGLKLFKTPDHASYAGDKTARDAAARRLDEHQSKLRRLPAFPARVAGPTTLAHDAKGRVAGYTMRLVSKADALLQWGQPAFRAQAGVFPNDAVAVLADLRKTVAALHRAGVVIGDFNDLNVLARKGEAWVIDADSMQWGGFACRMFSPRFLDPLLSGPDAPELVRPHNRDSDWYAYALMFFQSLVLVGAFGGVHRPKPGKARVPHDKRALARVSVMHPDVAYPKPATPLDRLPADLLHLFQEIFEKDRRGEFPAHAVEALRWTTCPKCGAAHARTSCPACGRPDATLTTKIVARGGIVAERVFRGDGVIVDADLSGPEPLVLTRESKDGAIVFRRWAGNRLESEMAGGPDAAARRLVRAGRTIVGGDAGFAAFAPNGAVLQRETTDRFLGREPVFTTNAGRLLWMRGGEIFREGPLGPGYAERVGQGLEGRTRLWVGAKLGFALYLTPGGAGGVLFDLNGGMRRDVVLPRFGERVVALDAAIADGMVWLLAETLEKGRRVNRCLALDVQGAILGAAEADPDESGWLGVISGRCAAGGFLLAATDDGIVRVEPQGGTLRPAKEFPSAAPFVDAATRLVVGRDGLHAVRTHEILKLEITS